MARIAIALGVLVVCMLWELVAMVVAVRALSRVHLLRPARHPRKTTKMSAAAIHRRLGSTARRGSAVAPVIAHERMMRGFATPVPGAPDVPEA